LIKNRRPTTSTVPPRPVTGSHSSNHSLTEFIIFLCSEEALFFFAFLHRYAACLKLSRVTGSPLGVEGAWSGARPLAFTAVLVSSSGTIALARMVLNRGNLGDSRASLPR